MLKLKNVSKFYYSKGIVSSGFTKVNLELERGEFVAITGESGSGKSTLLNVISGLDSYEEGEMFVDGEDTSAYTEADFEIYRRKYISNIFQSFNLVNSYTVYQNIEMVLLINGYKKKEYQKLIYSVLKRVGLYKYRNTKASKLSGGQKQRVAIARALVKNTPIIVADEPTGNLDSKSAENIIKLLSKISKDKLVIVVTHNYEQVEPYVTRKITMHDGQIVEDVKLKEQKSEETQNKAPAKATFGKMRFLSKIKIGMRNTFNIVPKFLLLFFIFLFATFSVTAFYSSIRKQSYQESTSGYSYYFDELSDKRIVLKKNDLSSFTDKDYAAIEELDNVDYIVKEDLMLDRGVYLASGMYYLSGKIHSLSEFTDTLDYGRMPEADNEIVVIISSQHYLGNDEESLNDLLQTAFSIYDNNTGDQINTKQVVVCGIKVVEKDSQHYYLDYYVSDDILTQVRHSINAAFSTTKVYVNGYEFENQQYSMEYKIMPAWWLNKGHAIVPESWNWYFSDGKCVEKEFKVTVGNLYYSKSNNFTIYTTYNEKNFEDKTELTDYYWNNGVILISTEDYNSFFTSDNYQISVFVKDHETVYDTLAQLKEMEYEPLYIKDAMRTYDSAWNVMNNVFRVIWSSILMIALFFIAYFIIKLIMKSRNVYFSTIRMLGATKKDCKMLLITDLITVLNFAFIVAIGVFCAATYGYINIAFILDMIEYLSWVDYAALYGILLLMSLVICQKYAKQLFGSTAMNTYREEL